MDRIADYRVLQRIDDPASGTARYRCAPPGRLGVADRDVLVEVLAADVADVMVPAAGVATVTARDPDVGDYLAVPLEVGPGEAPGTCWLSRRLSPIGDRATAATLAAAAAALAALHAAGITHGAVGAGRVLPTATGGALDLPPWGPVPGPLLRAASPGAIDTVAPEVLRGEPPQPAADVWALGALVVATAAGGWAHPGIDADDLLGALARAASVAPDARAVGGDLGELAAACLQRDPDRRPSAADVAAALPALVAP